jgi:hypothetical protein
MDSASIRQEGMTKGRRAQSAFPGKTTGPLSSEPGFALDQAVSQARDLPVSFDGDTRAAADRFRNGWQFIEVSPPSFPGFTEPARHA